MGHAAGFNSFKKRNLEMFTGGVQINGRASLVWNSRGKRALLALKDVEDGMTGAFLI